jgi:hypothetical protein
MDNEGLSGEVLVDEDFFASFSGISRSRQGSASSLRLPSDLCRWPNHVKPH